MPIKPVPLREGKSPYWSGRGTHLGRYVERSTKALTKSLAQKVIRKWEREIERGEFAEPGEPTFASAVVNYLNAGGDPRPTSKLLEYFKTMPLNKIDGEAIDACAMMLFPAQSPATRNREVYATWMRRYAGLDVRGLVGTGRWDKYAVGRALRPTSSLARKRWHLNSCRRQRTGWAWRNRGKSENGGQPLDFAGQRMPFSRERSKVRSLVRPPLGLNNQRLNELLPRGCAPEKLGHNGGTAFLDDYQNRSTTVPTITHRLRAQPARCCGHPEILCLNRRQDRSSAVTRLASCPYSRNNDISITCGTVSSDDHPISIKGSKGP
jgi:hypothetical protein